MGNIQRINNALASIEKKLPEAESKLATLQTQLEAAREEVKKPFPQANELEEKSARLAELNSLLNMDERGGSEAVVLDDSSDTMEEHAPHTHTQQVRDGGQESDRPAKGNSVLARLHEKQAARREKDPRTRIINRYGTARGRQLVNPFGGVLFMKGDVLFAEIDTDNTASGERLCPGISPAPQTFRRTQIFYWYC